MSLVNYFQHHRRMLKLSIPMILIGLIETSASIVNTFLAVQFKETSFIAVALGSSAFFTISVFLMGVLSTVSVLVASGSYTCSNVHSNSNFMLYIVISFILGIVGWGALKLVIPLTALFLTHAPYLTNLRFYLNIYSISLIPNVIAFTLLQICYGHHKTAMPLFITFLIVLITMTINSLYIFSGLYSSSTHPEQIFGYSNLIAQSLASIILFIFLLRQGIASIKGCFNLFNIKQFKRMTKRLLVIGIPIAAASSIELGFFSVLSYIFGYIGNAQIVAYQITIQFVAVMTVVYFRYSSALAILIAEFDYDGHLAHKQKQSILIASIQTFIVLSSLLAFLVYILGYQIINYSLTYSGFDSDTIRHVTMLFLKLAIIFQVVDGLRILCSGYFKGIKSTNIITNNSLITFWFLAFPIIMILALLKIDNVSEFIWGMLILSVCIGSIHFLHKIRNLDRLNE